MHYPSTCSDLFKAFGNFREERWNADEREALKQLRIFAIRPQSMLMALYYEFFRVKRQSFTRILTTIAVITLRYNIICKLPTNELGTLYNEITQKVIDGEYTTCSQILKALQRCYPDDLQFKAAFAEKELSTTKMIGRKIVRYILFTVVP